MDWGSLGLVFVGGLLTIVGGFLSQWWSGRQAIAFEQRDRAHEREVWARQLRYEAHIGFLSEFESTWNGAIKAEAYGSRNHGAEPEYDHLVPLYDRLTVLRTVSDQKTIDAAKQALDALSGYVFGPPNGSVEEGRDRYLVAMREEFGLAPIRTYEHRALPESAVERFTGSLLPPDEPANT